MGFLVAHRLLTILVARVRKAYEKRACSPGTVHKRNARNTFQKQRFKRWFDVMVDSAASAGFTRRCDNKARRRSAPTSACVARRRSPARRRAERGHDAWPSPRSSNGPYFSTRRDAGLAHVARDYPGECAAQIDREAVRRLIAVQLERAHRLVRRLERLLEIEPDVQRPVEEVGVVVRGAAVADVAQAARHLGRPRRPDRQDDLVALLGNVPERLADERVQALEVLLARSPAP